MAYEEFEADRIRQHFKERGVSFEEKKMIGGLCFMVDGKMCCGTHTDKKLECNLLMCRIGEEAYPKVINKKGCLPMDFTGRPMKGYVFVKPEGVDMEKDLAFWLDLALAFNPLAKASKKRKKKT